MWRGSICFVMQRRYYSSDYYRKNDVSIESIKREFQRLETNDDGNVQLKIMKNLAKIEFQNLRKRNAFSAKMMVQLHDISTELEKMCETDGNLQALLFQSQDNDDGIFCSGGDLDTVRQISNPDGGFKMSTLMHDATSRLQNLPLISAVYVNGRAIGGGAELTLWPDFRFFRRDGTKISFVQGKMGVITGWGGGTRLVDLVGRNRALDIFLSCRTLTADDAISIGLCDNHDIVQDSQDAQLKLLNKVTSLDPKVTRAFKTVICRRNLDFERRTFAPLWGGPANQMALEQNLKHRQ